MLNPTVVDDYIAIYTAHELRELLPFHGLTEFERAHIIAAIYYLENKEN